MQLLQGPEPAKDGQQLPVKDNNCIVSDVHQEPVEESDADNDFVPVEIRPGHIRFEPLSKGLLLLSSTLSLLASEVYQIAVWLISLE